MSDSQICQMCEAERKEHDVWVGAGVHDGYTLVCWECHVILNDEAEILKPQTAEGAQN